MKNLFAFLFAISALTAAAQTSSTGTRIMDMPLFLGNPNGVYLPGVVAGVNRRLDAGQLGYNKLDSLVVNGPAIDVYRNGGRIYSLAIPSGETGATIRTKIGAASGTNGGYLLAADFLTFAGKQPALGYTAENITKRGIANGYAPLDAAGKVPIAYMPTSGFTYVGTWNAATNTPTLSDATGSSGQVYTVNFGGTQNLGSGSLTLAAGDQLIHSGTTWQKVTNSSAVQSVAGKIGVISLTAADIDTTTSRTWISPAEKLAFAAKQPALGYTPLSNAAGAVTNTSLASGIDASKLTTGTLPDARLGAYTGDVTKAAGGNTLTVTPGLDPAKLGAQTVSRTEFGFLDLVTGPIQGQIDSKAGLNSPAFTGTPTAPTAAVSTTNTQVASTAFVKNVVATLPGLAFKQASAGYRLGGYINDTIYRIRALQFIGATVDTSTTDSLMKVTITGAGSGSYSLQGSLANLSPAAGATYYIGSISGAITSTNGVNRIYIQKAGTISKVTIHYTTITGAVATNTESSTFSLGYVANGALTSSETYTSIATTTWGQSREGKIESTNLSKPVQAGDWVEVRAVMPTTVATGTSLPTGVRISLQIWVD